MFNAIILNYIALRQLEKFSFCKVVLQSLNDLKVRIRIIRGSEVQNTLIVFTNIEIKHIVPGNRILLDFYIYLFPHILRSPNNKVNRLLST